MFSGKFKPQLIICVLLGISLWQLLAACGTATSTPLPATATASPTPAPTLTPTQAPSTPAALTPTRPAATAPGQPDTGYGGKEYTYDEVISNRYENGTPAEAYYIFEPKNSDNKPLTLPVIIFLHGYNGVNPDVGYLPWISHLVKRGNIVIFPVYQLYQERNGEKFTDNALAALKNAFAELQTGKHAQAELDKLTIVGYSAGGVIATNYTTRAAKAGLPIPKALFAVTPGGCSNCSVFSIDKFWLAEVSELKALPADLKMVVLVGDRDSVVGLTAADIIWQATAQIPAANRSYVQVITDAYGNPGLLADHGMPNRQPPTAHNYYGIWKIEDALQSCALSGKGCEFALGGTPQQRNLGKWSDGRPITELKILG